MAHGLAAWGSWPRCATTRNGIDPMTIRSRTFSELAYETLQRDGMPALGVVRYTGPPVDLAPGQRLFTPGASSSAGRRVPPKTR